MLTRLQLERNTALTPDWKWRSKDGTFRDPADMETTHLFYVLRMIWNHTMPIEAHVRTPGRPINYYTFGEFYTVDYMKSAILHIWAELTTRSDIPVWAQIQLAQMHRWYSHRLHQQSREVGYERVDGGGVSNDKT